MSAPGTAISDGHATLSVVALSGVTGVFGRFFIVGFFLPAYFVLTALVLTVTGHLLPDRYEGLSLASQFVVLGAVALLVALFLNGVHGSIHAMYSGYAPALVSGLARADAETRRADAYNAVLRRLFLERLRKQRQNIVAANRDDLLDVRFGTDETRIRPTRFGNAARTFEDYARDRWNLNAITAWRQIEADLTDGQRERLVDAGTDVAFFLNLSLLLWAAIVVIVIDQKYRPLDLGWVAMTLGFLAGGYVAYRFASRAVETQASVTKALIDLGHADVKDPE